MWILFIGLAIISTVINWRMYFLKKDYRLPMVMALAFTALSICAEYRLATKWVKREDWSALMDVLPTMEGYLWIFTILMILLNGIPIFLEKRKR